MQDEWIIGETVHARGDYGWRWVGRPYADGDGLGYWATRQGKTSRLSGKPSMQEGTMDGDGWVAPTWMLNNIYNFAHDEIRPSKTSSSLHSVEEL